MSSRNPSEARGSTTVAARWALAARSCRMVTWILNREKGSLRVGSRTRGGRARRGANGLEIASAPAPRAGGALGANQLQTCNSVTVTQTATQYSATVTQYSFAPRSPSRTASRPSQTVTPYLSWFGRRHATTPIGYSHLPEVSQGFTDKGRNT